MTSAIAAKLGLKLWRLDFVGAYLNSVTKEDIVTIRCLFISYDTFHLAIFQLLIVDDTFSYALSSLAY
jgi:hypothetical protein